MLFLISRLLLENVQVEVSECRDWLNRALLFISLKIEVHERAREFKLFAVV